MVLSQQPPTNCKKNDNFLKEILASFCDKTETKNDFCHMFQSKWTSDIL